MMAKGILSNNETQQLILNQPTQEMIDSKLELLKHMSEIQGNFKKHISSDFVLAKLNDKHRDAITESVSTAFFAKSVMDLITNTAYKWKYDHNKKEWHKIPLDQNQTRYMTALSQKTFDSYMIRPYMVSILNRNRSMNHLIRIMAGYDENEETEIKKEHDNNDKMDQIKNLINQKMGTDPI